MTAPSALPSLHWPSFGKAMAFEGSGLVITALLLEWTTTTPEFDGSFYPWGIALLVPGFLVGWLVITLPWMATRYLRERALGVSYVLPALVRAAVTLAFARSLVTGDEAEQALFILGCLGGGWLLASIGIYSLLWSSARKQGRLEDPRALPFAPEVLLFAAMASLLVLVAWLQVDPLVWESVSPPSLAAMAGIWAVGLLALCVFVATWRNRGREWTAPRLLLLLSCWVAFVVIAHEPLLRHDGIAFWAELFFPGAHFGIWGVALAVVPSIYLYLVLLRDPRPFAEPLARSGWAMLTAFGAEALVLFVISDATVVWRTPLPDGELTAAHAWIPLVCAWALVRAPGLALDRRDRAMSDGSWLALCLLSTGFAPVVHFQLVGETALLGTVYLQAAVASVIGAGLYRLDCRMRAQAGFEH